MQIFMKFDIWVFLEKSVDKIYVSLKSDNNGYFITYMFRPNTRPSAER
jgi:hypothetical protein